MTLSSPCGVIGNGLDFPSDDAKFWWDETVSILGGMLDAAGYDVPSQYRILLFYFRHIIAHLGPRPSKDVSGNASPYFKSFMADDYSPIELSWSWDSIMATPNVRFSIEAISTLSGTPKDPFNQHATLNLISTLSGNFPNVNWKKFQHFLEAFRHSTQRNPTEDDYETISHHSTLALGFNFNGDQLNVGAYTVPAISLSNPRAGWEMTYGAILEYEMLTKTQSPVKSLHRFLTDTKAGRELSYVGLGMDCVHATKSRLKIYFRSQHTSAQSIRSILTMESLVPSPWTDFVLEKFQQLLVLMRLDFDKVSQQTLSLGMLYNFDINSGREHPYPRIYIPVKHYGQNDLATAKGLTQFQRQEGSPKHMIDYVDMLRKIHTDQALELSNGVQTYIAISPKEESLSIATYVSPQTYSHTTLEE